tara:strand:+ start:1315 stop:1935 length:621 start_codon:yes stop_codon:yes gene_type:complete
MDIDKSAIIEEGSKIGENVIIGANTFIGASTIIEDDVVIGKNCIIGSNPDQPQIHLLGDGKGEIVIKSSTVIKDFVVISKPTINEYTEIKKKCYLMTNAYIAHDCSLEEGVILGHGSRLSGFTKVGRYSNIGAGAVTHQNAEIGDCVIVGANSFVKGKLISGLKYVGTNNKIVGVNKIGIERSNLTNSEKEELIKKAIKIIKVTDS